MTADTVESIQLVEWPVGSSEIGVDRWTDGHWRLSLRLGLDRRRFGSGVAVVTPLELRGLADMLARAADEIEAQP